MKQVQPYWPRVHLVYFALACLDVLAILGGLWLSHTLINGHRASLTQSEWIERNASLVRDASDRVADAQSDLTEAVFSNKISLQRDSFDTRISFAMQDIRTVKASFAQQDIKRSDRILNLLARMEKEIAAYAAEAEKGFVLSLRGDRAAAVNAVRQSQSRYVTLRASMRDITRAFSVIETASRKGAESVLQDMSFYEKVIASLIAVVVIAVLIYGHSVGRLMKRKYGELHSALQRAEQSEANARQAAEELQSVNSAIATLNRELANNMQALQSAQDELLRKGRMEQLGQLIATIAHEIRNPLGAVRTSIFLLERRVKGKGLGLESQIERINKGVARCDDIIGQLLDFSRNKPLKCEAGDLDSWLEKSLNEEAQRLPPAVEIMCELGLNGVKVPFDPGRLQRAVGNLLSNASEAMVGQGDDPKKFATPWPKITIRTSRMGACVAVSVQDNGPGIPPAILDKIREPLYTTKSFGTGLGIPAVEQIAVQHGGKLEIESGAGKGATFTIILPLVQAEAA